MHDKTLYVHRISNRLNLSIDFSIYSGRHILPLSIIILKAKATWTYPANTSANTKSATIVKIRRKSNRLVLIFKHTRIHQDMMWKFSITLIGYVNLRGFNMRNNEPFKIRVFFMWSLGIFSLGIEIQGLVRRWGSS